MRLHRSPHWESSIVVEGIAECSHTFVWWWHTDRPQQYWYFQTASNGRVRLTDIFGKDDWSRCSFVQVVMATDDDVDYIRRNEPDMPNVGGMDGPDRPPPDPPRTPVKRPYLDRDDDVQVDSDHDPSDPISHDPSATSRSTSRSRSDRRSPHRQTPSSPRSSR